MRRSHFMLAAGIALVVLIAVVALLDFGKAPDARLATSLTPPPTSTLTPPPTSTPSATASPAAVLDDRFGFVSTSFARQPSVLPDAVRREGDPRTTHDLVDGLGSPRRSVTQTPFSYGLAVSPDGRRLAYWTAIFDPNNTQFPLELQLLDLALGTRPRTLLTLTPEFGDVVGESVVWSSDGTGLVIGVGSSPLRCGADGPPCPPKQSALYLLEAGDGKPRVIASIRGNTLVPVAWDRQTRRVAAFEFERPGSAVLAYDLIEESGALDRTQMVIGSGIVAASYDAKHVLVHEYSSVGSQVVHVWPLASPERAVVLSPGSELVLAPARWRPGTAEIGVLFANRLELWDTTGARKSVPLPSAPSPPELRPFFFRIDGSAAFVGKYYQGPFLAMELASGRSALIPGEGWLAASVRVGP